MLNWHEKIQPLCDMPPLSQEEQNDYYVTIGELLEGGMAEEDVAYLIFGEQIALPDGASEVLWGR